MKVRLPEGLAEEIRLEAQARQLDPTSIVVWAVGEWLRENRISKEAPKTIVLPDDIKRTRNATGFVGIYPNGKRFQARYKGAILGHFDTPEEAALFRYQHIKGEAEADQQEADRLLAELMARPDPKPVIKFFPFAIRPGESTADYQARIKREDEEKAGKAKPPRHASDVEIDDSKPKHDFQDVYLDEDDLEPVAACTKCKMTFAAFKAAGQPSCGGT